MGKSLSAKQKAALAKGRAKLKHLRSLGRGKKKVYTMAQARKRFTNFYKHKSKKRKAYDLAHTAKRLSRGRRWFRRPNAYDYPGLDTKRKKK